jgi:prolyl-tRNA synthetase
VIVPILRKENKESILKESAIIKEKIKELGIKVELDLSEKSPGEKFHIWELKGVPLRLEIGENEIKAKELTLSIRTSDKKEKIKISELKKLNTIIEKYDQELFKKADNTIRGKIIDAKTKKEVLEILDKGCIARINFCSTDEPGAKCAAIVEKEMNAEVRGTMANKKESASGNCLICGKKATEVIYIGRSY